MCGIVAIFCKNNQLEKQLGQHLSDMLLQMAERGPDSSGVALYNSAKQNEKTSKIVLFSEDERHWQTLPLDIESHFDIKLTSKKQHNHLLLTLDKSTHNQEIQSYLRENYPDVRIMSVGHNIEIYKEKGLPQSFIDNFDLNKWQGTHALGHTRMATESAITTEHSHPFSTGQDLCLVHNGSLSNHNDLRRFLKKQGIVFQTDNDTEVAAGYFAWKLSQGLSLDDAMQDAFVDLDGFYTFAVGTADGFAVVRDGIACKPAVIAETDDWVAMASEYRAIATLPNAAQAKTWEPEPNRVYSWHNH